MALTGKSGMFELSGTNGITAQFTWSETYDVGSNTSIISIDSVKVKSSLYENVEYFPNGSITVDGTAVVTFRSSSGTHDVYIDNLNRYYELDGSPAAPWKSGAVLHNADGSKAAVIGVDIFFATLSGGSGHGAKISANKSVELTQIPRASAIKEAAATTLGGYCAVKWTPLASAFRYRVKLSLGTWSLDSGILYPASTAEYTYRAIIPLEVANQIPNSPSGTMTASLLTYSDSNGAVQIGNTDTETFAVTVPNNSDTQPDPGMTLQAVSTLPSKFAGLYIQGKTKVDANFAGSGKYEAKVKSYGMLVDGKNYASPFTSGYLSKTGSVEVVGTATDSRGYSGKQTSSIYVIPYADPKIQTSICGRCDASGNLSDSGTRLRIKATRSYSKVVDKAGKSYNTCGIQYRYAQAGGSYGNWVTILANGSGSDTVDTGAISGITLAVDMSYLVQIRALDDIGGEAMTTVSLPTEKVFMHRNGPKNSVGFGGYENDPNTVSIAEDMTFHVKGTAKGITAAMVGAAPAGYGLGTGCVAPPNNSLNEAVVNGWYACSPNYEGAPTGHQSIGYGVVLVSCRYANQVTQEYWCEPTAGIVGSPLKLIRIKDPANGWQPWEWVNPPIEISDTSGVREYRTTERYNGKPVYVHSVYMGALPDNATLYMKYNDLKMQDIVSLDIEIYSNSTKFFGPFYYLNSANLDIAIACYPMVTYGANKTNQVTMICLGSLGGYLCRYTIKYTKC